FGGDVESEARIMEDAARKMSAAFGRPIEEYRDKLHQLFMRFGDMKRAQEVLALGEGTARATGGRINEQMIARLYGIIESEAGLEGAKRMVERQFRRGGGSPELTHMMENVRTTEDFTKALQ